MNRFTSPRAGRPENARVSSVRTNSGSVSAFLCTGSAPDSGQARKAVPSCAASAPAASSAAICEPRMRPPAAMIGRATASRTWATSASSPTAAVPSAWGSSRWVPWWPPASTPWTHTASAPACWAVRASSTEVAVTTVYVPALRRAARAAEEGQPKVNETTGTGSSRRMASLAS